MIPELDHNVLLLLLLLPLLLLLSTPHCCQSCSVPPGSASCRSHNVGMCDLTCSSGSNSTARGTAANLQRALKSRPKCCCCSGCSATNQCSLYTARLLLLLLLPFAGQGDHEGRPCRPSPGAAPIRSC
jgi:hypothetical protein